MKTSEKDMAVMLDELGLPAAALRWKELSGSPEYPWLSLYRSSICDTNSTLPDGV